MSVRENLREFLVMDGGEGAATLERVLVGGGGTKGEAVVARGGVVFRSAFFDTGDEEAGEGWRTALVGAAFFRREDFMGVCFVELRGRSMILAHADFAWGFVVAVAVDFCRPACLVERRVEDELMFVVCLMIFKRYCRMIRIV